MKPYPFVVASTSGDVALEIIEFRSVDPVANRDVKSFSFLVRTEPDDNIRLLRVLFSGTSFMFPIRELGLPAYKDLQTGFEVVAVAAVGDYLDEKGVPSPNGPEASVLTINCFSDRFGTWRDRSPASDETVESYLRSHLYWAWKFSHQSWNADMPDRVRLNLAISRIDRMVSLHDGENWEVVLREGDSISLKPKSGFLRDEQRRRQAARDLSSIEPKLVPRDSDNTASDVPPYISDMRINDLKRCDNADFDLSKLIAISKELNQCWYRQCYHAVSALNRALMDHIPPLFDCRNFREVASSYSGGRSFKACMERLEKSARKIADQHLHTPIRYSEVLPSGTQVNFSNDIDVLLAEIVRIKCGK